MLMKKNKFISYVLKEIRNIVSDVYPNKHKGVVTADVYLNDENVYESWKFIVTTKRTNIENKKVLSKPKLIEVNIEPIVTLHYGEGKTINYPNTNWVSYNVRWDSEFKKFLEREVLMGVSDYE